MSIETVKRANELVEYTPENLLELKKCSEDPIYFIKNYCKIEHPGQGLVNFTLYPFQEEMIQAYVDNRFVLTENSRQSGKCVLFTTNINICYKPIGIKKLILKLIFRKTYNEIFRK